MQENGYKFGGVVALLALLVIVVWSFMTGVTNTVVQRLAKAIAKAEGFGIAGAIPTQANNPGDLKLGDLGNGVLGAGITVLDSVDDGWARLEGQVTLMLAGTSRFYQPSMTILQVAQVYTGYDNAQSWAQSVANDMGADINTPIGDLT